MQKSKHTIGIHFALIYQEEPLSQVWVIVKDTWETMVAQSSLDLSQVQQPPAHNTQCCWASCSKEMVSTDRSCRAVFKFCVLRFFGVILNSLNQVFVTLG